jgi:hypothetical protein
MKVKKIYKSKIGGWHTFTCDICSDMTKRGYTSEAKYWDDLFANKLKPIKYKLVKVVR